MASHRIVKGTYSRVEDGGLQHYEKGDTVRDLTKSALKQLGGNVREVEDDDGDESEPSGSKMVASAKDGIKEAKDSNSLETVEDETDPDAEENPDSDEQNEDEDDYPLGDMDIPQALKAVSKMTTSEAKESYKLEKNGLKRTKVLAALKTRASGEKSGAIKLPSKPLTKKKTSA